MAVGVSSTRVVSTTVTAASPTVTVTKVGAARIVSVTATRLAPEVTLAGVTFPDLVGGSAVVTFKVQGPTTSTAYAVNLAVGEVADS